MHNPTKHSIWAKFVAVSFIGLVLLCNLWFAYYISASPAPWWLGLAFQIFVVTAISSGTVLGLRKLVQRLGSEPGE